MLERFSGGELSKAGEQGAMKPTEGITPAEGSLNEIRQEGFRVGEMSAAELKDLQGIRQREMQAADELRALVDQFQKDIPQNSPDMVVQTKDQPFGVTGEPYKDILKSGLEPDARGDADLPRKDAEQPQSTDFIDMHEVNPERAIKNKEDGIQREVQFHDWLNEKYPPEDGYKIIRESYLRDQYGNIVRDTVTGEGRRIDYVVVDKNGKVVDAFEVTSPTASKETQMSKEGRIRDNGGHFVKDPDTGQLYDVSEVSTKITRIP